MKSFQFYPRSTRSLRLSLIASDKSSLSILSKINGPSHQRRIERAEFPFNSIQDQHKPIVPQSAEKRANFQFYPRSTGIGVLTGNSDTSNLSILSKINGT